MVGHIVRHMADYGAHAVIVLPNLREDWGPRVGRATVRALALSPTDTLGSPQRRDGVREFGYARHGLRAVELDFRGKV